jgi:hypothetical protein
MCKLHIRVLSLPNLRHSYTFRFKTSILRRLDRFLLFSQIWSTVTKNLNPTPRLTASPVARYKRTTGVQFDPRGQEDGKFKSQRRDPNGLRGRTDQFLAKNWVRMQYMDNSWTCLAIRVWPRRAHDATELMK